MKLKLVYFCLAFAFLSCAKEKGFHDYQMQNVQFDGTILDYLKSKPGVYDSLLKVIQRVGMEKALNDSALTLFAPTNGSFQLAIENLNNTRKKADQPLEYLGVVKYEQLDTMMSHYIITGQFLGDSLAQQDGRSLLDFRYKHRMQGKLSTSNSSGYINGGPKVIEFSDAKNSQFIRNWVTTTTASINIKTTNGVVHVLNADHVFGFDDFVTRLTYVPPPPSLFVTVGGTFSVSRETGDGPNAVEASKYLFDGNPETKFFLGGFGNAEWMQFELNNPAVANAYTLTSANDLQDRDPADWSIQASHDGSNWVTLDGRASQEFTARFQLRVFRMNNTTAYKYYRLSVLRIRGGDAFQLADWSVNFEEK